MSLWQFAAAVDGFNKFQAGDDHAEPLSETEFDAMLAQNAEWIAAQGAPKGNP